ncbi:hypothetical protein V8E36_004769 [Tilletia maclaganii]
MTSHRLARLTLATPSSAPAGNDAVQGDEAQNVSTASTAVGASGPSQFKMTTNDSDDHASSSAASASDPPELYDSVRNSRTIEDFTRFVSELRLNRQASRSTLPGTPHQHTSSSQHAPSTGSIHAAAASGDDSASTLSDEHHPHHIHTLSTSRHYDDDNASILDDMSIRYGDHGRSASSARLPVSVRCTCCCNKPDCERAARAMSEWAALEEDLRLAAEIGQSLLHKHDAAVSALTKAQDEHVQQRDSLMNRLTQSIRESAGLQRQLTQTTLNLEAADASNRTLLSELDESRTASKTLKRSQARLSIVEKQLEKLTRELDDARAEVKAERKRAEVAELKAKKLAVKAQTLTDKLDFARREADLMAEKAASPQLGEDAIREARERLQLSLRATSSSSGADADGAPGQDGKADEPALLELRAELEVVNAENTRLKDENRETSIALEAAKEEVAQLRETLQEHTLSISPGFGPGSRQHLSVAGASQLRKPSGASISTAFSDTYSIPASKGSTAGRSEVGQDEGGAEDGLDGDETSMLASAPVSLSDEIVTRDLTAPTIRSSPTPAASLPTAHSEGSEEEAGSIVSKSTNRGGGAASWVISPTTTSAASTMESVANPTEEGHADKSGLGLTSTAGSVGSASQTTISSAKPPSIRSQSSIKHHQRSGSVASSLRGTGVAADNIGLPGGRSSASIAFSTSDASSSPSSTALASAGNYLSVGTGSASAAAAAAAAAADPTRDTRTAQLSNLLESVTRIYNRLVTADIDTLHRRLQRQHLAGGDVGHLARTTVNSIVRDVEALRAHFRKLTDAEQRALLLQQQQQQQAASSINASNGSASDSLVARRDFFALLKLFQNLFAETARLRACVNEIHLQPSAASKILSEQLGLSVVNAGAGEGSGGVGGLIGGGWLARMFTAAPGTMPPGPGSGVPVTPGVAGSNVATPFMPGPGQSPAGGPAANTGAATMPITPTLGASRQNSSASVLGTPTGEGTVPLPSVSGSGVKTPAPPPRAANVEVKARARGGSATPSVEQGSDELAGAAAARPQAGPGRGTLSRAQSRNLSGLFVGAGKSASAATAPAPAAAATEGLPATTNPGDESWDVASQADLSQSLGTSASQRQSIFFRSNNGVARQRPLSRIVDDDEISIHQGRRGYGGGAGTTPAALARGGVISAETGNDRAGDEDDFQRFTSAAARANAEGGAGPSANRTLRRRGLSDSSMHSNFLEQGGGAGGDRAGAGNSAAGILARGPGAGGGAGGALASLRTSPMARIITPATLSLQVSSNASGRTSAQFARSGLGKVTAPAPAPASTSPALAQPTISSGATAVTNWSVGVSSPSVSEGSGASFSTGGAREKRSAAAAAAAAASTGGPRGLMPSLRAAPSAVALLFPGAGTARTASASSSLSATNAEAAGLGSGSKGSSTSPGKTSGGLAR